MKAYHKIDSMFKRDMTSPRNPLILGEWAREEFEYLADNTWEFTEKVDGTNIRVMVSDGITFGGKTDNASIPAPLVKRLQERFLPMAELLAEMFPAGACMYGEGYGARIQKGGGNYRPDQDLVLFDIRVADWWLQRKDVEDIAGKLALDVVPVIGQGTLYDAVSVARGGFTSRWGEFPAEGLVARPLVELKTRAGHRIITKLKHLDFNQIQDARSSDRPTPSP